MSLLPTTLPPPMPDSFGRGNVNGVTITQTSFQGGVAMNIGGLGDKNDEDCDHFVKFTTSMVRTTMHLVWTMCRSTHHHDPDSVSPGHLPST